MIFNRYNQQSAKNPTTKWHWSTALALNINNNNIIIIINISQSNSSTTRCGGYITLAAFRGFLVWINSQAPLANADVPKIAVQMRASTDIIKVPCDWHGYSWHYKMLQIIIRLWFAESELHWIQKIINAISNNFKVNFGI